MIFEKCEASALSCSLGMTIQTKAVKRLFSQVDVGSIDNIENANRISKQIRSRTEKVVAVGVYKCTERLQPVSSPVKQDLESSRIPCAYSCNPAFGIKRRKIELPKAVKSILKSNTRSGAMTKKMVSFNDSPMIRSYERDTTKPMRPIKMKKRNRTRQMRSKHYGFTFSAPVMIGSVLDTSVGKLDACVGATPIDHSEDDTEDEDANDDEFDTEDAKTSLMRLFTDDEMKKQTSESWSDDGLQEKGGQSLQVQRSKSVQAVSVFKTDSVSMKFSCAVKCRQTFSFKIVEK